jgi:endonuclease V-like protein UPF0215 family
MAPATRPHLLGLDDGPVSKGSPDGVVLVAVVMEGADLVEGVAITRFPVDGPDATSFLADWIGGLRFRPALQGILLGGITIAGLGVIDLAELARRTDVPVISVNRRDPRDHQLERALRAAGLEERLSIVERSPRAVRPGTRVYLSCAGTSPEEAAQLLRSCTRKSDLPEPLRVAHLIARAVTTGQSRGRA